MAPDPREVRIDSHVEYNGDRCRVSYIAPMDKIYQFFLRRKDYPFDIHAHIFEISPIPITPELLTELGFEWNKHLNEWRKESVGNTPFIGFHEMHDGLYRMEVADNKYVYGNMICKHLHQAESFLYLTTKQELIND